MDYKEFRNTLVKSKMKKIIIGSSVLAIGLFMIYLIFCGQDTKLDQTEKGGIGVLWALACVSLFIGCFILFGPVRSILRIRSGKHPVIAAIEGKDFGYIIWMHEYKNKIKTGSTEKSIWMYSVKGKKFVLSFKKEKIEAAMIFLSSVFTDAQVGYTDEARNKIYQLKKGSR